MTKFFRIQEGWLTVGLLALLLFSVTLSIQQAQWSDGLSILTPITIVGLATGIVLAKVRDVPRFLLDLVGLMIGVVTVLLAVASVMRDPRLVTIQDRVQDLLGRTASWVDVAVRQDMSDDLVVFILSLSVVVWVLAYSSAYFVFRSRQLWWALVPCGVALLINLSYSVVNLNGYIIVFMFSALLLMIRFNLLMKEERWQRERVNYSPGLTWAFLWAGSAVSIVVALAMWYVPAQAVNSTLNSMWERVNKPWLDFQNRMAELWSPVNGNQSFGGYSSFNKSFAMGGSLNLSDEVALIVDSKERHYWRTTTWDEYTGQGWRNTAQDTFNVEGLSPLLALDENQRLVEQDEMRNPVTVTVQVLLPKGDLVFAASRPVQLSMPSKLETSWRPLDEKYNVDSFYTGVDARSINSVPLEVRSLIILLHEAQRKLRNAVQPCDLASGLDCLYTTPEGEQIKNQVEELKGRGITVVLDVAPASDFSIDVLANGQVPVYDDLTTVHATQALQRDSTYTTVSMITEAKDAELRVAGTEYPDWVRDRYLKVPVTVPSSVGDMAQQIVASAGASNPYDQAKAIEEYLRNNYEYSTSITPPPPGVDRVQWFLFEGKKGYCEYYASAMVVMLRHVGIPARLAGGYAPGTLDAATGKFVVKESSAHAWPEVYFPQYGWIEFEPTPSQAAITHQEEPPAIADVPTPVPTVGPDGSPTARTDEGGLKEPQRFPGSPNGPSNFGMPGDGWGWLVAAGMAALGILLLFKLPASPLSRGSKSANAGFYYTRMLFWTRLMKVGPAAHQTPYEFSESLAREVPGTSLFARTIARAYVREKYGRDDLDPAEKRTVSGAYESLRSRLLRTWPGRQLRGASKRRR